MHQYLSMLDHIMTHGKPRLNRTGVDTIGVFGYQARFSLEDQFPLVTTKRIHWKSVAHELLWMLSGSTSVLDLQKVGVRIWDEWANENGDLGPVYGYQWRYWGNQLDALIDGLKADPNSRRHIVSAWNVEDLPVMRLPPCHMLYQMYVDNGRLSCHMFQRSADAFLGVPFNIASYALLTYIIAKICGMKPQELIISFGDLHIYKNHLEQVETQLKRQPLSPSQLEVSDKVTCIYDVKFENLCLLGYEAHESLKGKVAV
jgi:thymidylate synthase